MGMMVSRPKTQFMDFMDFICKCSEQVNREPVQITGQELEIVIHFKYKKIKVEWKQRSQNE